MEQAGDHQPEAPDGRYCPYPSLVGRNLVNELLGVRSLGDDQTGHCQDAQDRQPDAAYYTHVTLLIWVTGRHVSCQACNMLHYYSIGSHASSPPASATTRSKRSMHCRTYLRFSW